MYTWWLQHAWNFKLYTRVFPQSLVIKRSTNWALCWSQVTQFIWYIYIYIYELIPWIWQCLQDFLDHWPPRAKNGSFRRCYGRPSIISYHRSLVWQASKSKSWNVIWNKIKICRTTFRLFSDLYSLWLFIWLLSYRQLNTHH